VIGGVPTRVGQYMLAASGRTRVAEFRWRRELGVSLVVFDPRNGRVAQEFFDHGVPLDGEDRLVPRAEPENFMRALLQPRRTSYFQYVNESSLDDSPPVAEVLRDATAECHALLLRLAGRVPDDLLAEGRHQLVTGDLLGLASDVVSAVLAQRLSLSEPDCVLLAGLLAAGGRDASVVGGVARHTDEPLPRHRFAPVSPEVLRMAQGAIRPRLDITAGDGSIADGLVDDLDRSIAAVVARDEAALGLWRSFRFPPAAGSSGRVYLVEVTRGARPYTLALRAQVALAQCGQAHPQVEVYATGDPLPWYQRWARDNATLLWARRTGSIEIAPVYDSVDPAAGPDFLPDHPRIGDPAERARTTDYLAAGAVLLVASAQADDIVEASRRRAVPLTLRTDGAWIWSDASTYYLTEHQLAPDPGLLAHIRGSGSGGEPVDGVAVFRALAALERPGGGLENAAQDYGLDTSLTNGPPYPGFPFTIAYRLPDAPEQLVFAYARQQSRLRHPLRIDPELRRAPGGGTTGVSLVTAAIAAARAGELARLHALVDWPLSVAGGMLRAAAHVDLADRDRLVAGGLTEFLAAVDDQALVREYLEPVAAWLAAAWEVRPADPARTRQVLDDLVPPEPDGLSSDRIAQLRELRSRANGLNEVLVAVADAGALPVVPSPETGRIVLPLDLIDLPEAFAWPA
jgi:hypothetical protein